MVASNDDGHTPRDELVGELRSRLQDRAWLLDDGASYRAGVEDTLDELAAALADRSELSSRAR